jgi:hypothetical protein
MHRDSSGDLHAAGTEAFRLAKSPDPWPDTPDGVRLFRAWLASIMGTIANLGPSPTRPLLPTESATLSAYLIEPVASSRPADLDWQQAFAYALGAIAWSAQGRTGGSPSDLALSAPLALATLDGEAPMTLALASVPGLTTTPDDTPPSETGIIPAIPIVTGIVIISCTAIAAAAVGWIVSQVAEVSAVGLAQKGKTTAAVEAMTRASEVVETHKDAEAKAGKPIDYDPEEQKLLEVLRSTITQTSGWQPPPLRSVPDVRGATSSIAKGLSVGEVIFLAAAGYALVKYASK